MKYKYHFSFLFILVFSLCMLPSITHAEEKQRNREEKKRTLFSRIKTTHNTLSEHTALDYGGWFNFRYDDYHNSDNDRATKDLSNYDISYDTRIWFKFAFWLQKKEIQKNPCFLFLQCKQVFMDQQPQESAGGYDADGPHIDYAYLSLNYSAYWFECGRKYFYIGKGITYSDVNDGLECGLSWNNFDMRIFASHTLPHEDNIDTSVPGYTKESDRYFYGIESAYLGIPYHRIYAYFLVQRDFSNESPEDTTHTYAYNSEYTGLGLNASLPCGMSYWTEIIRESGTSYIYDRETRKNISALAGDAGIRYTCPIYGKPTLSIEYGFGTGDKDRSSVTDTQGGNTHGNDKNFSYFGYIATGNALFPRLSNLHFFHYGLTLKPFEKIDWLRKFTVGSDYFTYYKWHAAGGIYDTEATNTNNDIGSEIDVSLDWEITSDLTLTLEYAHFIPGDAYPATTNDAEDYFSVSTVLTF